MIDTRKNKKETIVGIHVVYEFPDVLPEELPGVPTEKQAEFRIDLIPGATLTAKAPYRLEPLEM